MHESTPAVTPQSAGTRLRLPRPVIALGLVSQFDDAAGDMISPLLPAFVASVGGGPEALGMIAKDWRTQLRAYSSSLRAISPIE